MERAAGADRVSATDPHKPLWTVTGAMRTFAQRVIGLAAAFIIHSTMRARERRWVAMLPRQRRK